MLGLINQNSTLLRVPKVLVDRKVQTARGGSSTVKSAVKSHQATTHHQQNVYYSQDFKGVPLNLFRNNGSRYSAQIEAKSFSKLKQATLKIVLTSTQAPSVGGILTGLPQWFERIEIRTQNGSKHLTTIYGDE
jgi:hypothetical protein